MRWLGELTAGRGGEEGREGCERISLVWHHVSQCIMALSNGS
jgi:hypothetical protein